MELSSILETIRLLMVFLSPCPCGTVGSPHWSTPAISSPQSLTSFLVPSLWLLVNIYIYLLRGPKFFSLNHMKPCCLLLKTSANLKTSKNHLKTSQKHYSLFLVFLIKLISYVCILFSLEEKQSVAPQPPPCPDAPVPCRCCPAAP
jgi:hypothetical protein